MNSRRVSQLKTKARKIKKEHSISHKEALDIVAKDIGFSSWYDFQNQINPTTPIKKLTFQESLDQQIDFNNPVGDPSERFEGIIQNDSGGYTIIKKISCIDYHDEYFNSYKNIKNEIDKDLKTAHRKNPNTFIHIVRVHLNIPTWCMLENPDKFMRQILKRRPWLHFILLSIGPLEDITHGDMDLFEGFPDYLPEIFLDQDFSSNEIVDLDTLLKTNKGKNLL